MPVRTVFVACAPILVIGCAGLDGATPLLADAPGAPGPATTGALSSNVPQDPQSGQRPSHFGET